MIDAPGPGDMRHRPRHAVRPSADALPRLLAPCSSSDISRHLGHPRPILSISLSRGPRATSSRGGAVNGALDIRQLPIPLREVAHKLTYSNARRICAALTAMASEARYPSTAEDRRTPIDMGRQVSLTHVPWEIHNLSDASLRQSAHIQSAPQPTHPNGMRVLSRAQPHLHWITCGVLDTHETA